MRTKIINAKTSQEMKLHMAEVLESFSPKLGIVFSSVKMNFEQIFAETKEFDFPIVGCSSCGEIDSSNITKTVKESSASIALIDIQESFFKTKFFDGNSKDSTELGMEIGMWGKSVFEKSAYIILVSGLQNDGEKIVNGIKASSGEESQIYGGLAGDDALFKETYVFDNSNLSSNGAVVILFDNSKVEVNGLATSGWIELGAAKTITKSEGNVVFTIDNEPALDVYKSYLDVRDDDLPSIGVEYPLIVFRDDGTNVLRAVLNVDKDKKTMTFAGSVPQGAKIKFSSSPGFEIIDYVKNDLSLIKKNYPSADLLLLFSCMARHLAIGPMVEEEIKEAINLWKSPLIGFFTYGEIGKNAKGKCDFYNETYSIVIIKEL